VGIYHQLNKEIIHHYFKVEINIFIDINYSWFVHIDPIDAVDSLYQPLSPTNYFDHQCLIKIGETPIARRERRTHELQKNRLMKNFFH
jgi:hypothetical protein